MLILGTAADIIEFFDSFKDDKIAAEPLLVLLTLAIWSWSLMQFTVVLTATKSRKSRLTSTGSIINRSNSCCTIDVWGIALNITLQDAPFLVFRLLLITHFKIISYMNVFFTCKNTLVILLQLYRLYVVHSEHRKKKTKDDFELTNISIISKPDMYGGRRKEKERYSSNQSRSKSRRNLREESEDSSDDLSEDYCANKKRKMKNCRKDTGYSTGSSHTSARIHKTKYKKSRNRDGSKERLSVDNRKMSKQKLKRSDQETKGKRRLEEAFSEESESDLSPIEKREEVKKEKPKLRSYEKEPTVSLSTSDPSSE
ncbi:hypothetical protein Zmor_005197 [Zophobas morio]|uniref:Transmembrane protein 26 n=1 Tax=Zophobas morio TaxID=2755281 RepID=A0AA38IMV7_9CUCU|nr:hypothetical protein Zmor_005197 [Zophobas morio]